MINKVELKKKCFDGLNFSVFHADEILFGSDQEKALTNAIDAVFGEGKRRICTLHLKKNLILYMRVIFI